MSKVPVHEIAGHEATTTGAVAHGQVPQDQLNRALSARQVQMIAFSGIIGTGLFLGTGKALATGGPGALLVCYTLVGAIVFLTMMSLGEMSAYIPVSGSFCTFSSRFIDDAFGFTMTWITWFNTAVSTAADMVALQIVLRYWTGVFPGWALSLIVLILLIAANIITVRAYGEVEYWLSLLKVVAIVAFIIVGVVVNAGGNTSHHYVGGENWYIPGAPFANGIGGFTSVFVSASYAYSGTESIAMTAGEAKDPTKNLPRAIKNVFWRILVFYFTSVLLIGLNIPYTSPDLAKGNAINTSPFIMVLEMTGARASASLINAVILTSAVSAGNHSIYVGGRLLYTLAVQRQAPGVFGKLSVRKVPWVGVLTTALASGLCFGSSHLGAGQLWVWLQNLIGVSSQVNWAAIGITSIRFRSALKLQNKTHLLPFRNWTYPAGPWLCVILNAFIILIQGWSCFSPRFNGISFVSFYIQLPVMAVLFVGWKVWKRTAWVALIDMDLDTDAHKAVRHRSNNQEMSFPCADTEPEAAVLDTNGDRKREVTDRSDAGRAATEDEVKTLRHVTDKIPLRVWLVALIAAAERFTYWSTQVTWQNYIQNGADDEIPGILGLGQSKAVAINNAFNVVVYLLPIFIGPIADSLIGRFAALQICTVVYLVGMGLLLAFSTPTAVAAGIALPGFIVALCLIAVGVGGVQAVTAPLIADQYDETVPKIAYGKDGERVVVDRDMTIHYIYSIYWWMANAASLGQIPTTLMEKHVSFWSAYTLTTGVLLASCSLLWVGKKRFVLHAPSGTDLPMAARVLWIAATSGFSLQAALPETQLERGNQVGWDDDFVRDIRQGLMAIKVCLVWPILRLCIGFISSNGIAQAGQMQTVGIPNDLFNAANSIALVIFGIMVENGLYPFLEKRKIVFGEMKRITLGLFVMALSMAILDLF
ncbi:amino acid permease [Metarhizium album ARSEF 1941]|uniref:Amino acid permease n=1 Tax=Metarhizium album (strain ARSEF 1941) TaxID=1081103 RepID=A0A0B2WJ54_METAS|nr:amino acid permease [Metarhizium album ARSEF 1941]KHN96076.1 amino acid permease [Metarhizium album ARSEF 1941]